MHIQFFEAEQKLIGMASAIGRDPLSWQGWSALYIDLGSMSDDMRQECLIWMKSVTQSYFGDIEGRVYVCHGRDVHIICKDANGDILAQAAQQISDLVFVQSSGEVLFKVYDFSENAHEYMQLILNKEGLGYSESIPFIEKLQNGGRIKNIQTIENQASGSPSHPVKVLLVEDDPVTRWMVRNVLKNKCEFVTAPTANKAFSVYNSYQPDIVFLDIGLPDKSGHSVLEWIMRNDPGACVVMFSGSNNLDNLASALENGATGFIKKPFLTEQLLHYIDHHTRQH